MKTTIVLISAAVLGAFAGLSIAQQGSAPRARPGTTVQKPASQPRSDETASRPTLVDCSTIQRDQKEQCEYLRKVQLECQSAPDFQACVRSKM